MPVTNVEKSLETKTLTFTAEFAAPLERVWQVYADPRQLEQIWGPPEYPATVVDHSFEPGGRVNYYMTSPEGEKYYGIWEVVTVDPPHTISFDDYFADENFDAVEGMPGSRCTYTFVQTEAGTTATYTAVYESAEAMQKVIDMGMIEGSTSSINQIDGFLAS